MARIVNLREKLSSPRPSFQKKRSSLPTKLLKSSPNIAPTPISQKREPLIKPLPPVPRSISWKTRLQNPVLRPQIRFIVALLLLGLGVLMWFWAGSKIAAIFFGFSAFLFLFKINASKQEMDIFADDHALIINREKIFYRNIESYWVHERADGVQELSIKMKHWYSPYLKIPLGVQDPETARNFFGLFILEQEHEPSVIDEFLRRLTK